MPYTCLGALSYGLTKVDDKICLAYKKCKACSPKKG